jgi:hypothetical protein
MSAPGWKYRINIAIQSARAGLKAMFEPSLKLERARVRAGFPALIQIARAKAAVKVADHACGSRDR